jgi:hypothetical protein
MKWGRGAEKSATNTATFFPFIALNFIALNFIAAARPAPLPSKR